MIKYVLPQSFLVRMVSKQTMVVIIVLQVKASLRNPLDCDSGAFLLRAWSDDVNHMHIWNASDLQLRMSQQQMVMGGQQQPGMGQAMAMQQPQMVQPMQPLPGPDQAPVGLRPVQVRPCSGASKQCL